MICRNAFSDLTLCLFSIRQFCDADFPQTIILAGFATLFRANWWDGISSTLFDTCNACKTQSKRQRPTWVGLPVHFWANFVTAIFFFWHAGIIADHRDRQQLRWFATETSNSASLRDFIGHFRCAGRNVRGTDEFAIPPRLTRSANGKQILVRMGTNGCEWLLMGANVKLALLCEWVSSPT